jgi:hypothetical protein
MYRRAFLEIAALAALFGRRARLESRAPRAYRPSRDSRHYNKDRECARRRRQMERGIYTGEVRYGL